MSGWSIGGIVVAGLVVLFLGFTLGPDIARYIRISRM